MAQIRNPKVLFNDSAAATGAWIKTSNGQWDEGKPYGISWIIATGDTVRIDVTNDVENEKTALEAPISSPAFTSSEAFDDTTTGTRVEASWRFIRAVKVGANGNLRVVGGV